MILRMARIFVNLILKPLGQQVIPLPSQQPSADSLEAPPFYQPSKTCQIPCIAYLYENFFGRRYDGIFVEVGAFDGESYSNTSCLADVGWYGQYIEPIPEFHAKCVARHSSNKNTCVHNIAIGSEKGEIELHVGGPMTTANEDHLETYKTLDWAKSEFLESTTVMARQCTLNTFLEKNGLLPNFDLLVVDVEGYEPAVFSGFDLDKWRPTMIIAEIGEIKSDLPHFHQQYARLNELICYHDYYVVYKDPINTVFVSRDHYRKIYKLD